MSVRVTFPHEYVISLQLLKGTHASFYLVSHHRVFYVIISHFIYY